MRTTHPASHRSGSLRARTSHDPERHWLSAPVTTGVTGACRVSSTSDLRVIGTEIGARGQGVFGEIVSNDIQDDRAEILCLARTDAIDIEEFGRGGRASPGQVPDGIVVKDDIGRDTSCAGHLQAALS